MYISFLYMSLALKETVQNHYYLIFLDEFQEEEIPVYVCIYLFPKSIIYTTGDCFAISSS